MMKRYISALCCMNYVVIDVVTSCIIVDVTKVSTKDNCVVGSKSWMSITVDLSKTWIRHSGFFAVRELLDP